MRNKDLELRDQSHGRCLCSASYLTSFKQQVGETGVTRSIREQSIEVDYVVLFFSP